MPYEAYRDKAKTQKINAQNTTIEDIKKEFFCKTSGCQAVMTLVNGASDNAYFRRKPKSAKHISVFCSADGNFDPTQYDENSFDFKKVAEGLMKVLAFSNCHSGEATGGKVITGGGGRKMLTTVDQIYCMCRKYDLYNEIDTTDILADERDYLKYEHGIKGYKIVQCTVYHKVKDENSYVMNFPSFPFQTNKYVKLNFSSEKLFWHFYNKFKSTNHKELIIVLGIWETPETEHIAECTIYNTRQIHFLKCEL